MKVKREADERRNDSITITGNKWRNASKSTMRSKKGGGAHPMRNGSGTNIIINKGTEDEH